MENFTVVTGSYHASPYHAHYSQAVTALKPPDLSSYNCAYVEQVNTTTKFPNNQHCVPYGNDVTGYTHIQAPVQLYQIPPVPSPPPIIEPRFYNAQLNSNPKPTGKENTVPVPLTQEPPPIKGVKRRKGSGSKAGPLSRRDEGESDEEIQELDVKQLKGAQLKPKKEDTASVQTRRLKSDDRLKIVEYITDETRWPDLKIKQAVYWAEVSYYRFYSLCPAYLECLSRRCSPGQPR